MGLEGFRVAGAGAGITSWRIGLLIWVFHTYSTVRNQQSRLWGRFWSRTVSIPRPLLPMSTILWERKCSLEMYIKKSSKCQKKAFLCSNYLYIHLRESGPSRALVLTEVVSEGKSGKCMHQIESCLYQPAEHKPKIVIQFLPTSTPLSLTINITPETYVTTT